MSAKHWKLVITPLSASALAGRPAREVVVGADNWLSALRSARKILGEEGGVPAGASVVMSSSGEVTILDSAQRLRYVLTRTEEASVAPITPPAAPLPAVAPTLPAPARRSVTVAYSPEDAAQARRQLAATQVQPPAPTAAPAGGSLPPGTPLVAAPGFAPSRPSSRPVATPRAAASEPPASVAVPAKRPATMAYTAEESGRLRAALEQARPSPTPAAPLAASEIAAPAAASLPNTPLVLPGKPAPAPADAVVAPARPNRKQTMAYSPEESLAARAQLLAAQAGARPPLRADALPDVQSMLVTLGYRDEEQGPGSQLTYRERSYYWPPPIVRSDVERALHGELGTMQRNLEGRPRGQYVNLAVFDHAFGERPERPPVATLQWKDWRGEPVLSWSGEVQASQWTASPTEHPVRTSFAPHQPGHEAAGGPASQPRLAPVAPAPPSPAVVPPAAPVAWPGTTLSARVPEGALQQTAPAVAWRDPMAPAVPQRMVAAPASFAAAPAAPFSTQAPLQQVEAPQQVAAPLVAAQPAPHSALLTPDPTTRQGNRDSTGDQDKRLAIAFEATQDLYFLATPADGLDFGVKLLQELVPSEAISGCIYDINTDEFRFVAVTGIGAPERRAAAVRSSSGLFAAAVRSGRDDLIIPDVANEPRYEPDCDGRTGLLAANMAFFPLHKADQLFGMLQLINRQGPRGFTESDVAVANYVANQLTEFLRSKRGLGRR